MRSWVVLALVCSAQLCGLDEGARVNRITRGLSADAKRIGLTYKGGGKRIANGSEEVFASYAVPFAVNLDNARLLYVTCVEELLSRLQADPSQRPHLANYPLTIDNIHLELSFAALPEWPISRKSITSVTPINGIVYFETHDSIYGESQIVLKEPYAESKRLVQKQLGRIPTLSNLPPLREPFRKT